MINKPLNNNFLYVIKGMMSVLKNICFFALIIIVKRPKPVYLILLIAIIFITGVYIFIEWKKTIFYIEDNMLVLEKGVFSHSKQEIPFDKINTINSCQTVLDRLFKVYTLKIDTGNVSKNKSEFEFILKPEIVKEIENTVLESKENNNENIKNENCEVYEKDNTKDGDKKWINKKVITKKELVKYALTKNKIFWGIGILLALLRFIDDAKKRFKLEFLDMEQYLDLNSLMNGSILKIVLFSVSVLVVVYVITILASIDFEIFHLNKFTITTYKDKIDISYGMFTKKQYSFKHEKIYGIKYKQTLLQQLIKVGSLEIITIGYGDEEDEKAILYPIISEKDKDDFLKNVLGNMVFKGEVHTAPKSSLKRFIFREVMIYGVILFVIYAIFHKIPINIKILGAILFLGYAAIKGAFMHKNTSLGITKKLINLSKGAFNKVTMVIKEEDIQSVMKKQSILQSKNSICSYKIGLYSNELEDTITVRYMRDDLYGNLEKTIVV